LPADLEIVISGVDWIMMTSPNEAQLTDKEAAANTAALVGYVLKYFGPACNAHGETAPIANKKEAHGDTALSIRTSTPILAGGDIPVPDAEHDGNAIHVNGPTQDEAMGPNDGTDHENEDLTGAATVDGKMSGVLGKTTGMASTDDVIQYLFVTDQIQSQELMMEPCTTGATLGDMFMQVLQGVLFRGFHQVTMSLAQPLLRAGPQECVVETLRTTDRRSLSTCSQGPTYLNTICGGRAWLICGGRAWREFV
jgi:hypothetical protein